MALAQWLSLGLDRDTLTLFESGSLNTVEGNGTLVIGIPKHGSGQHVLGTAPSEEDAAMIAGILRMFNPDRSSAMVH